MRTPRRTLLLMFFVCCGASAAQEALEVRRAEVFAAVLAAWKPFFDGPTAPFSWEPDQVEVLASGELSLSTGLVKSTIPASPAGPRPEEVDRLI